MKKMIQVTFLIFILSILAACGEADVTGLVIDKSDYDLLVAENLSESDYEEIKDIPPMELQNNDIQDGSHTLGLRQIEYDHTDEIEIGQMIEAWIDEGELELYPPQSKAKKIKVIEK